MITKDKQTDRQTIGEQGVVGEETEKGRMERKA